MLNRLEIYDDELRQAIEPLEQSIALMQVLYPVTLAVSVLIGAGLAGLLTLGAAREAAIMRVLGMPRRRVRRILAAQQLLLCIIGLAAGLIGVAILGGSLAQALLCAELYLLGAMAGAIFAAARVSNRQPLELLQVKE